LRCEGFIYGTYEPTKSLAIRERHFEAFSVSLTATCRTRFTARVRSCSWKARLGTSKQLKRPRRSDDLIRSRARRTSGPRYPNRLRAVALNPSAQNMAGSSTQRIVLGSERQPRGLFSLDTPEEQSVLLCPRNILPSPRNTSSGEDRQISLGYLNRTERYIDTPSPRTCRTEVEWSPRRVGRRYSARLD
jgi:hypothetical protein